MKLEPPLANLVARCQTICVSECCGADAYDFSPIQMASYLTMHRGKPDESEIQILRDQIASLRVNYGIAGTSGRGVVFEEMNQGFTAEQVEELACKLVTNLEVALNLIKESERLRYRRD